MIGHIGVLLGGCLEAVVHARALGLVTDRTQPDEMVDGDGGGVVVNVVFGPLEDPCKFGHLLARDEIPGHIRMPGTISERRLLTDAVGARPHPARSLLRTVGVEVDAPHRGVA